MCGECLTHPQQSSLYSRPIFLAGIRQGDKDPTCLIRTPVSLFGRSKQFSGLKFERRPAVLRLDLAREDSQPTSDVSATVSAYSSVMILQMTSLNVSPRGFLLSPFFDDTIKFIPFMHF